MESTHAVNALGALAHESRLALVRTLIQAGPEGVAAGALARSADLAATTASAQLLVLKNAGLVASRRRGRAVIYTANYSTMSQLLAYLMQNCCGGCAEICAPLEEALA